MISLNSFSIKKAATPDRAPKIGQRPLKREFVTYWSIESLLDPLSFNSRYAPGGLNDGSQIILPQEIKFSDLNIFVGRKTKVTIEVIE